MGAPGSGGMAEKNVRPFDPDRPIYERQLSESDKAWAAFIAYRDLPGSERTFAKAATALHKHVRYQGIIREWSARFGWRQRMLEYDRHMDAEERKAKVEEVAKAHREMLLVASSMWKLAAKDLMRWHQRFKATDEKAKEKNKRARPQLTVKEIQGLADAGMKLNRVLLGEPDSITEERHEVTVNKERSALRGLLMDKKALAAMDVIAERIDGGSRGNGHADGSGNGAEPAVH